MVDAGDLRAYWFVAEHQEMNTVEIDGWRLKEWLDVGDEVSDEGVRRSRYHVYFEEIEEMTEKAGEPASVAVTDPPDANWMATSPGNVKQGYGCIRRRDTGRLRRRSTLRRRTSMEITRTTRWPERF